MTNFKKFHQQPEFYTLEGVFSPTDHASKRESKFFIILITSIFRNKSHALYAVIVAYSTYPSSYSTTTI